MRLALPLALLALLLPLSSRAAPGSLAPGLLERVARDGRVLVVVEVAENAVPEGWLSRPADVQAQRRRIVGSQIEAVYGLGGSDAGPVRPYPVIPFMAVEVGPSGLAALEASPFVRSVRAAKVHAPQLDETVPIVQADQAHARGLDGTGQVVVVLDTGTDTGHQNFPVGKVVEEACFADGANGAGLPQAGGGDCPGGGDTAFGGGAAVPCDYHSDCFHGTHVAGIAAGVGPEESGVATGAGLIPIQVFSEFPGSDPDCGGDPCPLSWSTDQDAALLHVYDTLRFSHTIASVNMSLGGGAYTTDCDASEASTKAAIDNLRSVGIAVVIAAGNGTCAVTPCTNEMSAPACISSSVSVSATNDSDAVPTWANRSALTSLFAPGRNLTAPYYTSTNLYITRSGTSMAAPHVAGAWAILRQALPGATVTTLLTALQDTGTHIEQGVNRINIHDALLDLGVFQCDDGLDNDNDGGVDDADVGCEDADDLSEQSPLLACDDGVDNDEDGDVDTADPGCKNANWVAEDPACSDGIDNDGDGGIDFDGTPKDLQCTLAHQVSEAPAPPSSSCGLGGEAALLLPLLLGLRRRRA